MTKTFVADNLSFNLFISFIIILRLVELLVARRNEKWLLKNGAILYGQKHYPLIVLLHTLFILSVILEYFFIGHSNLIIPLLILYIILIIAKIWTISSLGMYWNTKIYRIPGSVFIKKGPYKYINHPNYIIVIWEIAVIPLVFGLYWTAIIFTIMNAIKLSVRIKEENKVWE